MKPSIAERFWSKVDKNGPEVRDGLGPCWVWTGGRESSGYGWFKMNGRPHVAHRAAFYLERDVWPSDCLLHRCDNRVCVRLDHLIEGSRAENNRDRDVKGRHNPPRAERNGATKLDAAALAEIRTAPRGTRGLAARLGVSHAAICQARKRMRLGLR